ncbi:c-type cytochrome domain-containing protein [Pedobacter gandavensis]|uniref:c-type cytochrome domain-containing protein n=1 Tax=Pedobacter gandavensis TaxID=2679963 RepID=UPI0029316031|nr:c-type cytochrome domain-containing protein [Pedobacter gandavensis]
MILLTIPEFIGRFHPILVHLPIGILLLGCLFQLLSINAKFVFLKPAIPLICLFGALAAIFSSASGYLLSESGDYDGDLVDLHFWMGITVSVLAMMLYFMYLKEVKEIFLNLTSATLIVLITLTGHYGGSLTHGSDYMTAALKGESSKVAIPPVPDVQKAIAYTHLVQPLLQNRCYSCHGAEKQKGKLRMDNISFMLKGGEEGTSLIPGRANESELIKRMLLPISNDDHMPPKEKPQLSAEEIAMLQWWINEGAKADKKVSDLKQSAEIKPVLLSFQVGASVLKKSVSSDIPEEEVEKADVAAIEKLKKAGVVLIPVLSNSNYLSASFVTAKADPEVLKLLEPLKKQLIWLNLANSSITDQSMANVAKLQNLRKINLSHTAITDKGLGLLKDLSKLQVINLVGTKVTATGVINQLKALKELQHLYLYQTGVEQKDQAKLKSIFKKVKLDFGNYSLPTLAQDTTEVK